MLPRRWLQFSLRFLFAAMLTSACVAWCFRPGIAKPEFALERFSRDNDASSGTENVGAHFRLTNAGPDSIWLDESRYDWKTEGKGDENGWDFGGGGISMVSHSQRRRLKPGESTVFVVRLDGYARTVQLGVEIANRRDQMRELFWSPSFPVPENLFTSKPP
jgi:hypothetical protein